MKIITKLSTDNINKDIAGILYLNIELSWLEVHSTLSVNY